MLTPRRRTRSLVAVAVAVAVSAAALVAAAGCSAPPEGVNSSPVPITVEGTLGPATGPGPAFTYDPALAPEGATMRAELGAAAGGTEGILSVRGLLPDRGYAVHAHRDNCGPTGDAAGPHYQDVPDPAAQTFSPSVDPEFANPTNEMWLDLRTDAAGAATVRSSVPWSISDRGPSSIIVHEAMGTATAPGEAGTAGGRVACLDLG